MVRSELEEIALDAAVAAELLETAEATMGRFVESGTEVLVSVVAHLWSSQPCLSLGLEIGEVYLNALLVNEQEIEEAPEILWKTESKKAAADWQSEH